MVKKNSAQKSPKKSSARKGNALQIIIQQAAELRADDASLSQKEAVSQAASYYREERGLPEPEARSRRTPPCKVDEQWVSRFKTMRQAKGQKSPLPRRAYCRASPPKSPKKCKRGRSASPKKAKKSSAKKSSAKKASAKKASAKKTKAVKAKVESPASPTKPKRKSKKSAAKKSAKAKSPKPAARRTTRSTAA